MAAGLRLCVLFPTLIRFFSLLILLFISTQITCQIVNSREGIHVLNPHELSHFIKDSSARIVYFKRKVETSSSLAFLREYEKAGKDLLPYNVYLGLVDCAATQTKDKYCPEDDTSDRYAYGFRNGEEKMALPLETLYDADAVVSSALHLTLIDNVPIIQQFSERLELERHCRKRCDIVFAFQRVLGTHEHRIFLEAAFLRLHKFAFVMTTTERAAFGLRTLESDGDFEHVIEEPAIWVLYCSQVKEDSTEECPHSNYRGQMEKMPLLLFLRALELPDWIEITSEEELEKLIYFQHRLHVAFLFLDKTCAEEMRNLAPQLGLWFKGSVGVVIIDMDRVSPRALNAIGIEEEKMILPAIGFRADNQNKTIVVMNGFDNAFQFLVDQLRNIRTTQEALPPINGTDLIRELDELQQDDEVALALQQTLKKTSSSPVKIPSLNTETFDALVKQNRLAVVLFYLQWDSVSQIALQVFETVSQTEPLLAGILHRMDCFDWTDICDREAIDAYPTIRIYRKDRSVPRVYLGPLHPEPFAETMYLYKMKNPVKLKSQKSVKSFISGRYKTNDILITLPSVALVGLVKEYEEIIKDAADQLHGRHLLGICENHICNQLKTTCNLSFPFVTIFKPSDPFEPYVNLPSVGQIKNSSHLAELITQSSLEIFPKLTEMNFVSYLKQGRTLVAFFRTMKNDHDIFRILGKIASEKYSANYLFFWMPLTETVATNILRALSPGKDLNTPSLLLIDHEKDSVFDFNGNDWKEQSIRSWLNNIYIGKLKPTGALQSGEWRPRLPGFDYLKFIEEDHVRDSDDRIVDDSLDTLEDLHRSRLYRLPGSSEKRRKMTMLERDSFSSSNNHGHFEL